MTSQVKPQSSEVLRLAVTARLFGRRRERPSAWVGGFVIVGGRAQGMLEWPLTG